MSSSDSEVDVDVDTVVQSATLTTPVLCGDLKKGAFVMLKGKPCRVTSTSFAKGGKHGATKGKINGKDIFTGATVEVNGVPSDRRMEAPVISFEELQVIDLDADGDLTLMNEDGEEVSGLSVEESLKDTTRRMF